MRLDEVLDKQTAFSPADAAIYGVDGDIQSDNDPDLFRLYTNPSHRGTYYLIRRADAAEVYSYTREEIVHAGFIGSAMYRVHLKYGTVVHHVSISTFMVGTREGSRAARKTDECDPPCKSYETCLGCSCPSGFACNPKGPNLCGDGNPCTCECA